MTNNFGKKILFSSAFLVLMAAGCNSSQEASVTPAPVAQNNDQTAAPAPAPTPVSPAPANPAPAAAPAPTPATPPAQSTIVLKLGSGGNLTATNGMTLYTFGSDTANTSNCTGSCAANWPPYTVSGTAQLAAATGINGNLGVITRADGKVQLTYKGMPVYFWVGDTKAGDATGNGINSFVVAKP